MGREDCATADATDVTRPSCAPAYTAGVILLAFALLLTPPAGTPPAATAASATPSAAPAVAAGAAFPAPACGLVPGWQQRDEARDFDAETLFEYKDGSAEAYFTYGFRRLEGVTCTNATGVELVIDVSELGDADHAWGFFAANQDAQAPVEAVGSARQILATSAALAKGSYYVEITATPDGDHRAALRAFLDALLPLLPGTAHEPAAVAFFPPDGREPGSIRLVPESVLGLRALKSGFVARYRVGRAFVVSAKDAPEAKATLAALRAHFGDTRPEPSLGEDAFAASDPYLGGLFVFQRGRHLAGVANVAAGEDGLTLAKALAAQLPQ